jgi:hypothetical protein
MANGFNMTKESLSAAQDSSSTNALSMTGLSLMRNACLTNKKVIPSRSVVQEFNYCLQLESDNNVCKMTVSENGTMFQANLEQLLCGITTATNTTSTGIRGITAAQKASGQKPVPIYLAYSSDGAKLTDTSGSALLSPFLTHYYLMVRNSMM